MSKMNKISVNEFFKEGYFEEIIKSFINLKSRDDIYNEASFQYELGYYLKSKIKEDCSDEEKYKVEFERNVKQFVDNVDKKINKHEMDICIYNKNDVSPNNCYAIELKFPSIQPDKKKKYKANGAYPETMKSIINDCIFANKLKNDYNFNSTFCITLVDSYAKNFYTLTGREKSYNEGDNAIYYVFRRDDADNKSAQYDKSINYIKKYPKDLDINWIDWNNKKNLGKYFIYRSK